MNREELAPRLDNMRLRLREIEKSLASPEMYGNPKEFQTLTRERMRLERVFSLFEEWEKTEQSVTEARQLLETETDPEFRQLLETEIGEGETLLPQKEQAVMFALIPPDPDDSRNVILEIRPAAGGEEAALFAGELFRAYCKYAERNGWRFDILDSSSTELGGIREVTMSLSGENVFSRLKYESGVHRVQRVPATEASGRIHTSTITISVLPEAEEQDEIRIRQEDLEISTFRSSGPGGQNVNRTDSAVRIRHIPSGLVTASQQERSQIRNREIALRILKSKLLEIRRREEAEKHAASKRAQVGTGDRSERVRTYNFPQNRITDHRFGVSAHNLPALMEGNFDLILEPLSEAESQMRLDDFLKEMP